MKILKRLLAFGTALSLLVGMTPTAVFAKDSTIALTSATQNTQSTATTQSNDTQEEYVTHTGSGSVTSTGSWWNQEIITMSELIGNTDPSTITKIVFETDTNCVIGYNETEEYEDYKGELTRWTHKNLTAGESLEVDDIWFDIDNWGTEKCGSYFSLVTSSGDEFTANVTWTVYSTEEPSGEDDTYNGVPIIKVGTPKKVYFSDWETENSLVFIPELDGTYQFTLTFDGGEHYVETTLSEFYVENGYNCWVQRDYSCDYTVSYPMKSGEIFHLDMVGEYNSYAVNVTVEKIVGVDHIEIAKSPKYKLIENYDGYYTYDDNGDKYFQYASWLATDDTEVKIVYEDGTSIFANLGDYVNGYEIYSYSNQANKHWVVGENESTVYYHGGYTVPLYVTVIENPVDHIELVNSTETTFVEGDGYLDPDTETTFIYYEKDISDAQIKIYFKDGTTKTANVGDDVDGYYVGSKQKGDWEVGDDNEIVISYLGNEVSMYVSVIEEPVDHIELYKSTDYTWMENYNGYYSTDYDENEYFYYKIKSWYIDDAQIKIYYKDGTTKIVNVGDEVDEEYISWDVNQYINHWTVGDDNEIIISYRDFEVTMNVSVIENPVDHIELYKATEKKLYENISGYLDEWSYEEPFFKYVYDTSDAQIKIYYKDGTSVIANVDDEVDGYYINCDDNQYENHWVVGDDNEIVISYLGYEVTMNISIVVWDSDNNFEISLGETVHVELLESDNEELNTAYIKFTPEEDGTYRFYSTGDEDTLGYLYDIDMNQLTYNDDGGESRNFSLSYELEAGETYSLKVKIYGDNGGEFDVAVEKVKGVDHIELLKSTETTWMENYDGHYTTDSDGDEYFYYLVYWWHIDDAQIKIVYDDGSYVVANVGDVVDGYYVSCDGNQYTNHWVVGDNNEFIITYRDKKVSMYVSVIESPVDHLEIVKPTEYKYVDGGGYKDIYESIRNVQVKVYFKDGTTKTAYVCEKLDGYIISVDGNTKNWTVGDDNEVFISYIDKEVTMYVSVIENPVDHLEVIKPTEYKFVENLDCDHGFDSDDNMFCWYRLEEEDVKDAQIKIYYKDGTTKIANVGDEVDGNRIECDSDQWEKHWVVGDDNEFIITYHGKEVTTTVSVIEESPVDHIELYKSTEYTFIENLNGYYFTDSDGNEYFQYYTYSSDINDAQIKIYYKDGTTKIANVGDRVDGHYFGCDDNQYENHWVVGDDNEIVISYLDHEVTMNVSVIENPVDHLEVVKPTEYQLIENCNGYYRNDSDGNEFYEYYFEDYYVKDAQIKIYYKDGTTKIANVGDRVDGYYIGCDENQMENHWVVGDDNEVIITYLNKEVATNISVIEESPVDHLEIVKPTEHKWSRENGRFVGQDVICQVGYFVELDDISDTQIKIVYKDGTYVVANVGDYVGVYYIGYEHDDYSSDCPHIWKVGDDNILTIYYRDKTVDMKVTVVESLDNSSENVGDISPDGIVDVKDKTSLSQYIAGWLDSEEIAELDISAMDLNGDGVVDVKDKTVLARHIAEWEGYEELPYLGE